MSALLRPSFQGTEHKVCESCGSTFYRDKRCTWAHWVRVRFCSRKCVGAAKTASAASVRPDIRSAFDKHVEHSPACWEWTGLKDKDGYGIFPYAKKQWRAHRLALILNGTEVPDGMMACHHCDNPGCVNPSHLYVGSDADNIRDKVARGRAPAGEQGYQAKLTNSDVGAIRRSTERVVVLAARYSVSHSTISMIRSRKTWKHIP